MDLPTLNNKYKFSQKRNILTHFAKFCFCYDHELVEVLELTFIILDTGKQVLWQTVKS